MTVLTALLGGLAASSIVAVGAVPIDTPVSLAAAAHTPQRRTVGVRAPPVARVHHTLPLMRHLPNERTSKLRALLGDHVRQILDLPNESSTKADYGIVASSSSSLGAAIIDVGPHPNVYTTTLTGGGGNDANVKVGPATAANHDVEYIAAVQAGTNNLSLIVDTGSSDTWFVKEGFVCLDMQYHQPATAATCQFGPAFKGNFPDGQIMDQHFNVTYGSVNGPFLNGLMGYSDLTVSNVIAHKQQIGLATRGAWNGDGVSSGILGLGLPGLTAAFVGSDTTGDSSETAIEYAPIVTTLQNQNISQFSLALSRDPASSFLAFGGAPPDVTVDSSTWTSAPVQKLALRSGAEQYMYYQIAVDRMQWNSSLLNYTSYAPPNFIVDSGTTMNLFPYDIASTVNALFVPHAQLDPLTATWFVQCDATPPTLSITIGGKRLLTNPASMILPHIRDDTGKLCASAIGVTSGFPYILGDVFLQELVAVFDTGSKEIKFAQRTRLTKSVGVV